MMESGPKAKQGGYRMSAGEDTASQEWPAVLADQKIALRVTGAATVMTAAILPSIVCTPCWT
jgi:hypothetical protein